MGPAARPYLLTDLRTLYYLILERVGRKKTAARKFALGIRPHESRVLRFRPDKSNACTRIALHDLAW